MDAVFVALADATRRQVLELLTQGDATATQLAERFPVTRQAITKHLQVLADAGLATSERRGRETQWTLTPAALAPAMAWMQSLGGEFEDRLAALQRHLDERRGDRQIGIAPRRPIAPTGPLRIAASGRPTPPQPPGRSLPDLRGGG